MGHWFAHQPIQQDSSGAREMISRLRALAVLPEYLRSGSNSLQTVTEWYLLAPWVRALHIVCTCRQNIKYQS